MTWFAGFLLVVILWGVYSHLSKQSRDLGITYDPFRKPVFYAILAYTIILGLGAIAATVNNLLGWV